MLVRSCDKQGGGLKSTFVKEDFVKYDGCKRRCGAGFFQSLRALKTKEGYPAVRLNSVSDGFCPWKAEFSSHDPDPAQVAALWIR